MNLRDFVHVWLDSYGNRYVNLTSFGSPVTVPLVMAGLVLQWAAGRYRFAPIPREME